jgi:hypothetical protein
MAVIGLAGTAIAEAATSPGGTAAAGTYAGSAAPGAAMPGPVGGASTTTGMQPGNPAPAMPSAASGASTARVAQAPSGVAAHAAQGPSGAAAPNAADPTAGTDVTFTVENGSLLIDAPTGPIALGSGLPGAATPFSHALGDVTVTDSRAAADAGWVTTVYSTAFSNTTNTGAPDIPVGAVSYWSGGTVGTPVGNGTFSPAQATAGAAVALDLSTGTPPTAYTHTGGTGDNSAVWDPTLIVHVPGDAVVGDYAGTVTHSVI